MAALATMLFMLAAAPEANAYLFASNGGESTLSAFTPGSDGALTQLGAPTDNYGPGNLLVQNGTGALRRLYVANTYSGTIGTYFITGSGGLLQVAGSPTWAGTPGPEGPTTSSRPAGMAISPNGQYLYVAEGVTSNVTIFQINDSNTTPLTRLGSVTSGSADGTSNTTSVAITPDGKYLYSANATNAEGAGIDTYSIGSNGLLTQVNPEGQEFACTGGSINNNPLAYSGLLAISPNGQWLYEDGDNAVGQPSVKVGVCGMQIGAGGSLTDVGGGPFTDTTVSGTGTTYSNPMGMAITPNNQNLYVANGDQATVSTMSIGQDGVLTQTATTATGTNPNGVAVSPDGLDLYVSNTGSGTISTYSIGSGGALTAVGTPVMSGSSATSGPTWLAQTGTVEPQLTVNVSSTGLPPGGLSVGGTATIPVTVTASNGPVSNASLTLAVGGAGNVKITGTPTGTTGFSLATGQSATFNYTVTGVTPGTAVLNGTVNATATDGTAITGSGTGTFQVAVRSLSVTITTDPSKVRLDADDEGNLQSKQIVVNVKLTNTTRNTLSSVQLIGLDPAPATPSQQLDKLAFPKGSLPKTYGTLAAGASLTKTFHLKVTGDGTYVLNGLALYSDPTLSSANARASGQGTFTVTAPLLYFTANKVGNPTVVSSGDAWFVSGHVRNLSSFQTLCVRPLAPDWIDNAGGLGPHQIGVVPVDQPAPALAGPLKPGETISFLMQVQTEVGGGGTSAVQLDPEATLGVPGDDCNVLKMLTQPVLDADDVKLKPNTTKFRLPVAPVDTTPAGFNPFEFFGGYAEGSAAVFAHLYESSYSICKNFTLSSLLTSLHNGGIAAVGVLSKLFHAAAVSAWFWYLATDEEKLQFEQEVANAFVTKAGAVWDGTLDQIEAVTGALMSKIQNAFLTGDWNSLFHALGDKSANVINEQAITVAEWEIALGLIAKTGPIARVIARARELQSGALTSLKAITPGRILNFAEMQRLWGLAYEDYRAFSRIAEEEGVLIGVRGRAPISVKNLEEGAVWKHENLKPKNVSPIDTQWLGFPDGDLGTVAFRTYSLKQREEIIEAIYNSKLSIAQRDVVLKRAETRFGESKYVKKIEHMGHEGVIDVGFNYADNGIVKANTSATRAFALEDNAGGAFRSGDAAIQPGGTYYRPYQENPALQQLADTTGPLPADAKLCIRDVVNAIKRLLCRVTGDMDGVYLTNLDGTALSEAKRIKVYGQLMAIGWQHPETLTWVLNGLFDFSDKTAILKGLELGGEAMMEFAPGGIVRATYLNLSDSTLANTGTNVSNYFVAILGGYTSFAKNSLKAVGDLWSPSPFVPAAG